MTTMQAHLTPARRYPCPGCATCRGTGHDRLLAALVLAAFVVVFVLRVLVPA